MCILDELCKDTLSTENILKYIDDYSIYSYYIGEELELKSRYSSPLREGDDNPSFTLFLGRQNRIYFKDHATTYKGDVFQFVRILMSNGNPVNVPFEQVLKRIDNDFNLGLYTENSCPGKLPLKRSISNIPQKEKFTIQVSSYKVITKEFRAYWGDKYDIQDSVRKMYNCTQVLAIHYSSVTSSNKFVKTPTTMCISYRVGGKCKLYFPFEVKSKKFQNDFPPNWIFGYLQLKYHLPFCIITKSEKEVMFFRQHFDYDTVAGKSENTMIPSHLMKKLFSKYEKIYIWLDNDEAGIKAQTKYIEKYPDLIPIVTNWEQKDPTDYYEYNKKLGLQQQSLNEILTLIK